MNENYRTQGYALLPSFLTNDLSKAIVDQLMKDAMAGGVSLDVRETSRVLRRKTFELFGSRYVPLRTLHWGLTPMVAGLIGQEIAPTFCLFRIYAKDDICRIHADTASCEHSMSLMLASDGGKPWSLDIATEPTPPRDRPPAEDFGGAGHVAVPMSPGDAVLYQGGTRRHGRLAPNPNKWSAHLFLFWVSRDGPYADKAEFPKIPE